MLDYAQARRLMVDCQLRTFDVNDVAVLDAFDAVPRERFVPPGSEPFAYIDRTLRLGGTEGDTRHLPASMPLPRRNQAPKHRDGTRVLDDRSLNGVYVNGRRVEWAPLKDGDQIVVGRHTLFFLDTATVGSAVPAAAGQTAD